jgi:hypothetical protein
MECANCGEVHSDFDLIDTNWCPQDRLIFCQRCAAASGTARRCPLCDRTLSNPGLFLVINGAVGLFFVSFIGGSDLLREYWGAPPAHPFVDPSDVVWFAAILAALVALTYAGFAVGWSRLRRQSARVHSRLAARTPLRVAPEPPPEIRWFPNPSRQTWRTIAWITGGAGVVIAGLFLVVVVSPIVFPDSVFAVVLFVSIPAALFLPIIYVVAVVGVRSMPTAWGVSAVGFHTRYLGKVPPRSRAFLAWEDITGLTITGLANRRALRMTTRLGPYTYQNVPESVCESVRSVFEEHHATVSTGQPADRVTLSGLGVRLVDGRAPADTEWRVNSFRRREVSYAAALLLLQAGLVYPLIRVYQLVGTGNGNIGVFFYPAGMAAGLLWLAYNSPREVGVSASGIATRGGRTARFVAWDSVDEFRTAFRGFSYRTVSGFEETVGLISRECTEFVARRLDSRVGVETLPRELGRMILPGRDLRNDRRVAATRWILALTILPAALEAIGAVLLFFPAFIFASILLLSLGWFPAFGLLLILPRWRSAPTFVQIFSDGIDVAYARRSPPLSLLQAVRFRDLRKVTAKGGPAPEMGVDTSLSAADEQYLRVVMRSGRVATLGPISPNVASTVLQYCPPSVR